MVVVDAGAAGAAGDVAGDVAAAAGVAAVAVERERLPPCSPFLLLLLLPFLLLLCLR